jgi:hypothetical protein
LATLAARRCRHRHRQHVKASPDAVSTDATPLAPSAAPCASPPPNPAPPPARPISPQPELPRPERLLPESSLPISSPVLSPPAAKRTRKAVKRCCKAKLLRGGGEEEDLRLSPLSCMSALHAPLLLPPTPPPVHSPTRLLPLHCGPLHSDRLY